MSNELYHYGILGMRWGVRRYQRPDGSLTSAGIRRYRANYKGEKMKNTGKAAIDAAKIEQKVAKLNRNKYGDQKKLKTSNYYYSKVLKTKRKGLIKDLSDSDIEYGRIKLKARRSTTGMFLLGTVIGTPLFGALLAAGYNAFGETPQKARELNAVRSEIIEDEKSRMQRAASYNKAYDKAVRDKEKADAADAKMKELYEGLAKTKIGRIREVTKNGNSEKVKAYSKAYDEAVRAQEKADSSNKKMKSSYKKLKK